MSTEIAIAFLSDQPTLLTFQELYSWVIWQFPQQLSEDWLHGAVKSSLPQTEWLPAAINHKEQRTRVYAHLSKTFTTPEEAANYLTIAPK